MVGNRSSRLVFSWPLALFLLISLDLTECYNRTGLERLFYDIFTRNSYNQLVRPSDEITGITEVQTELKILQIDLDEKYQELVSTVWIEMTWMDPRLSWNLTDYDNVTEVTLPVSKLWVPDIVLQNGVGRNEYLNEMKYFNPWISHTGIITWVPEIRLHTRCLIKVADFPFDQQCCEINFYSWAHTIKQMKIQQYDNKNVTNTTHLSFNTEWNVYHTCALHKIIVTSEELHWWVTSYVIYIKRHTAYHIYNLLMPCFVLSMMSMLLFLLPPDSGEKITLGVTILLAFFVNSLVVSNYTPEATSDLPVIGIYYVFNIGFVSVSVGTSVCVLNFHFRGHRVTPVPSWLKKILFIKDDPVESAQLAQSLSETYGYGNTSHHHHHHQNQSQSGSMRRGVDSLKVKDSSNGNDSGPDQFAPSYLLNKTVITTKSLITPTGDHQRVLSPIQQVYRTTVRHDHSPSPGCLRNECLNEIKFDVNKNASSSNLYTKSRVRNSADSTGRTKEFELIRSPERFLDYKVKNEFNDEDDDDTYPVYSRKPMTSRQHHQQQHRETSNSTREKFSSGVYDSIPITNNLNAVLMSKREETMEMIVKLIKKAIRLIEKSKLRATTLHLINDEWKEVASRVDLMLFIVACSIITLSPIFLFGKFFVYEGMFYTKAAGSPHACGCS